MKIIAISRYFVGRNFEFFFAITLHYGFADSLENFYSLAEIFCFSGYKPRRSKPKCLTHHGYGK